MVFGASACPPSQNSSATSSPRLGHCRASRPKKDIPSPQSSLLLARHAVLYADTKCRGGVCFSHSGVVITGMATPSKLDNLLCKDAEFTVGDRVWFNARHLSAPPGCPKLQPRYRGPFTITERTGKVAYRVALPPTYSCHDVFHASLVLGDLPRHPQMHAREATVGWLPIPDEEGGPTDGSTISLISAAPEARPTILSSGDKTGPPGSRPPTVTNCQAFPFVLVAASSASASALRTPSVSPLSPPRIRRRDVTQPSHPPDAPLVVKKIKK